MNDILEKRIRVYGIVQGVGFRPTVDRLAHEAGITGTVANKGSFVEIFAEGTNDEISDFLSLLKTKAPERSDVLKIEVEDASTEEINRGRSSRDFCEETREVSGTTRFSSQKSPVERDFYEETRELSGTTQENNMRKFKDFSIIESEKLKAEIFISPDIAICDKCKAELFDKTNRRYLHPFINCNECGPRFSILKVLPYDRERTSMSVFSMCDECKDEYYSPASRRYDAQPVCCNSCGPKVYIIETDSTVDFVKVVDDDSIVEAEFSHEIAGETKHVNAADNNGIGKCKIHDGAAITLARKVLCQGGIVAVKGIGGFHLACDATNEEAVSRLRNLKHRPMKPFAVMAKDENVAKRECIILDAQYREMIGHRKPIILMKKKADGKIVEEVAPENPYVGLMLPYAPVQMLLFDYPDEWQEKMPDVLVMTSGNISGAPIASNDDEAVNELSNMCDCIISNNRDIQIRTDDSVMDYYEDEPYMIRRSRGIAPLPVILGQTSGGSKSSYSSKLSYVDKSSEGNMVFDNTTPATKIASGKNACAVKNNIFNGKVLGIGGELKNTFCLGINNMFYPSAYVGDLADIRTVSALKGAIEKTEKLLEMKPEIVACDLHPKYNSAFVAEEIAEKENIKLIRVQHHYAHVLSCMAENDYFDDVIGVSFDGTGYGTDGTIWGGEFLLSNLEGFSREASIMPFAQIGGDASSKEGWRIATSMIFSLFCEDGIDIAARLGLSDEKTLKVQKTMLDKKINSVISTSVGRLFDAVSAILGIRNKSTFEGEASTALMYHALEYNDEHGKSEINIEQKLAVEIESIAEYDLPEAIVSKAEPNGAARSPVQDHLRTDLLVKKIVEEKLEGRDATELSYLFHEALAHMIVFETLRISETSGVKTAALTGGVFQNKLLLSMTEKGLNEKGINVLRHHMIPPNDGGIALGQAVKASYELKNVDNFRKFSD